jgi:Bifunctional DNA primase/polymerase, N-terminal
MGIPEEIEAVALIGWHVYPCSSVSRAACFKGATDAASCNLDAIAEWCRRFPRCNWRVVMEPSGLWGLDVDVPPLHAHDGRANLKRFVADRGPLPPHPITRSGGGGNALFFAWHGEPIVGRSNAPCLGVDPRRGRLSVTIPPSRHIDTGEPYVWLRAPWQISAPSAPDWLLAAVSPPPEPERRAAPVLSDGDKARKYATEALRREIETVATAAPSTANNTLNVSAYKLARFLSDGTLTTEEIRESLLAAARVRAIPYREAIATIDSAIRARR